MLHSLSLILDVAVERFRQSLDARFPTRAGESALALTAIDRGMIRGRNETAEHFAARLTRWRYPRGHRVRGNAFALLEQVSEYFGGVDCYTIDVSGNRSFRTAEGVCTTERGVDWPWGDYPPGEWGHFWIVVDNTGLTVTTEDIDAIRRLMTWRAWKPAGVRAEWVIFAPGGTVDPDGWMHWSYNDAGTQRPRTEGIIFGSLNPDLNNWYTGDPTNFPYAVQLPTDEPDPAVDYTGDASNWPTTITAPGDGSTYQGDPTHWATRVLLFDDGDGL